MIRTEFRRAWGIIYRGSIILNENISYCGKVTWDKLLDILRRAPGIIPRYELERCPPAL